MRPPNAYDNFGHDAASLHRDRPIPPVYVNTARSGDGRSPLFFLARIAARYWTAFAFKSGLLRRLMYANLKLDWFFEFREYWVKKLGMRKIDLHDWYHLHGTYRQKFQDINVAENASPEEFLHIWQQPAAIYLLFAYQYKLAMQPLMAWPLARYISLGANVCEYGCGLAPITQSLIRYYPEKRLRFTVADIPLHMLHFLRWKFKDTPYVNILSIDPANDAPLAETYDVITCMTVLEHLPRPLPITEHLYNQLKPGGIFIFDYIQSEGAGLDTAAGARDRTAVLTFIRDHFTIIEGQIPKTGSISQPVICKKV